VGCGNDDPVGSLVGLVTLVMCSSIPAVRQSFHIFLI